VGGVEGWENTERVIVNVGIEKREKKEKKKGLVPPDDLILSDRE